MKNLLFAVVLAALGFALLLPGSVAVAADSALTGKGEASYTKKKDAMAAREDAIEAATIEAVRKALTELVGEEAASKNAEVIEAELLPTAMGLVKRSEVVSEKDRDKTYIVVVKAWVDMEALSDNLASLKISQDVGSRRSIAVVIDEYFSGDLKPSSEPLVARELNVSAVDYARDSGMAASSSDYAQGSSNANVSANDRVSVAGAGSASGSYRDNSSSSYAQGSDASMEAWDTEAFSSFSMSLTEYFPPDVLKQPRPDPASAAGISKRLLDRDVKLSDPAQNDEMRRKLIGTSGVLADLMADPSRLSVQALEVASSYGVDAMMIGTTAIVYNGEVQGGHQATANLAVRIVDCVTGDIVAYAVRSQAGVAADSQSAATKAAQRLGDVLGQDLGEQLFAYWKKRDEKGIEITLRFVGVQGTRETLLLEDAIKPVDGIESLEQRLFDKNNGIIEFVATTRRPPTELRGDLLRGLYKEAAFENLEQEVSVGTQWTFRLR